MWDHSCERFTKVAGGTIDSLANGGGIASPRFGPGRFTSLSEEQHRDHTITLVVRVCKNHYTMISTPYSVVLKCKANTNRLN
jgi:hypothetical protein